MTDTEHYFEDAYYQAMRIIAALIVARGASAVTISEATLVTAPPRISMQHVDGGVRIAVHPLSTWTGEEPTP